MLFNKSALSIISGVKNFLGNYGRLKSIGHDNGREFRNKMLNDYIQTNGIKFINEFPYKPNSRGVYKIVHKNDIVVNIILAWMGAMGISNYNGVTSPAYDVYEINLNKISI